MKELFSSRGFKIVIAVVFIFLAVILYNASTGNSFFSSLFGLVSTPMQQISGSAADAAGAVIGENMTPEQLRAENEQLRKELAEKNNQLVDYYKIKEENEQYIQYLELKRENPDFQFVSATKIGADPNEYFYGFMIDKGTLQGVAKNDPVITSSGLVGYISDVGATYAKVKTILDASISVGAHNARTRDGGVISGTVKLADEGLAKMRYISNQHQMKVGDLVCTSGLGGIYPYGLTIGTIREIKPEEHDISLYALIEPAIDVRKVVDVFVIIDFEGQGEVVEEDITPERGAYATGEEGDMTITTSSQGGESGGDSSGASDSSGETDSDAAGTSSNGG